MTEIQVDIDRLEITLEGVPAGAAEEAMLGLDEELHRLLVRGLWRTQADAGATEIFGISMVEETSSQDSAVLRRTISQRLAERIVQLAAPAENGAV